MAKSFVEDVQRQALAGITERSCGFGTQLLREPLAPRTEMVSPPGPGVFDDMAETVISAEALESAVPEGDKGSESAVIKSLRQGLQPGGQQVEWQKELELS